MSDPQQPQVPPYASSPQPYPSQPVPPAGQPGYGTQPAQPQGYVLNGHTPQAGHPAPDYSAPGAPGYPAPRPSAGNAPARIGLIMGLIAVGGELLFNVISRILLFSSDYRIVDMLYMVGTPLALIAAVLALTFGIVGLRRPGAPHGMAGIATGIGLAVTCGIVVNFFINVLTPLVYDLF
ncbi:hypothetical protein [Microbacterium sp. CIAB417]|uniref:hypothetical protein n=1 Tax=Microbacterium sp. CIAB417 TaxID=2860287 RepID=UPI001FAB6F3D|nr:hypothetical protein [Microbacterium sp. CIAB417]